MADELEDRLRRGLSAAASAHEPALRADAAAEAVLRGAQAHARRPGWDRLGAAVRPGPARNRLLAGLVVTGAVAAVAALLVVRPSTNLSTAARSARTSAGAAHSLSGSGSGASVGGQTPPPLVVTQTDRGQTVSLRVGQTLEVRLSGGGSQRWSEPRSAAATMLEETATSANSTTGDASGTFVARTPGSTRVSSDARPICPAGQACPDFVRLWTITVDVVR
ncbi:MAG TPA: hypothetical protein VNF50_09655 [Acidimicrobiales bacterium]|nr:hypothetical protein [Acidimicrobiales bacterium]